jgi:dTDP-4-dehydrorhamnose reductase
MCDDARHQMKLLVVGREGQLARSLREGVQGSRIDLAAVGRRDIDLLDAASIASVVARERPDLVVNGAAYAAVDQAESEPYRAHAINALGAGNIASVCAENAIPMIHISTDYVFSGDKERPYREDDPTDPINAYGRSKLEGEQRVADECKRHLILRTSWVHSPWGSNFVKTMLRLATERRVIGVVDDQKGAPTYAPDLAGLVLALADRASTEGDAVSWGVYHAVGGGETTWCGFAREVFSAAVEEGLPAARVEPITTADYPTPARRPANSRLSCDKLRQAFGLELPHWQGGVRECVRRLALMGREFGA